MLILIAAFVASVALVWITSGHAGAAIAYACGLAAFAACGAAFARYGGQTEKDGTAAPDWSVTVAAIEAPDVAIAITDRANRMVCANALYTQWFGTSHAPPNLPVDRSSLEKLTRAARDAWRDGAGTADPLEASDSQTIWTAAADRAGRGEDYLIWRVNRQVTPDPALSLSAELTGQLGRLFSQAGIESALVGADGIIQAAGAGFAERAAGDASATLAGQDYVSLLRSDEKDRIFYAREGRRGTPQTLIHVPLSEGAMPAADEAPSLMLLVDSGVGIGGSSGAGFDTGSMKAPAIPQLEALLGALPLGLAMTDRDGRLLFANSAFTRAVGYEGRALPQYPSDLVMREDKGALADAVRRFGKGPANNGDMAVRLLDQPDEPVSLGLAGVRGLGEASVLLSLADSSEETKLKRQVAQATKMQAVGQLAGGVAHDFNNVLTAIIGYCDLMLLRHTPGDSDYDDIQQIRANSNRAASLTRQLLAFSRQQTLRPEILQLPDVVSEVSQLLKRLLGEKVTLRVRHDRDLGPVRADPQQLEQVIVNLAVNARDAMLASPEGTGRLTLATRRVSASDIRKMGSDILPVADYTVLLVQDTGGGIPADKLGKIFEPFFTTKELGKGTGLGLSTVYGIVKQSGGFIFADNIGTAGQKPEGARFTVYLPVYHGELPEQKTAEPAEVKREATPWSGGGRVLLVEDEDMVRAVAERALSRAGYKVTPCSDGEEGLAAIANGGEYDVVVSDVVMPGMDGPAMVRAIRRVYPDLPVLFMSGYAEEQLRRDIDVENMHFLPKPFSVQQIGERVGAILSGGGTRDAA
ncbi:response regulator [Pseudopontixanthobacter vadosimaris]|uniref:hybrid sensor histidine kinase/response regulator n=1 Tax=Pseudopontixanthobacter vadosimaris TaxID=2726450 RepID=UPI001F10DAC2|nr:response regulator [Pseudopontixanthobacter vadosimaris]